MLLHTLQPPPLVRDVLSGSNVYSLSLILRNMTKNIQTRNEANTQSELDAVHDVYATLREMRDEYSALCAGAVVKLRAGEEPTCIGCKLGTDAGCGEESD